MPLLAATALALVSSSAAPVDLGEAIVARARARAQLAEDAAGVLAPLCCVSALDATRGQLQRLEEGVEDQREAERERAALGKDASVEHHKAAYDAAQRAHAATAFRSAALDEVVDEVLERRWKVELVLGVVGGGGLLFAAVAFGLTRRRRRTLLGGA